MVDVLLCSLVGEPALRSAFPSTQYERILAPKPVYHFGIYKVPNGDKWSCYTHPTFEIINFSGHFDPFKHAMTRCPVQSPDMLHLWENPCRIV